MHKNIPIFLSSLKYQRIAKGVDNFFSTLDIKSLFGDNSSPKTSFYLVGEVWVFLPRFVHVSLHRVLIRKVLVGFRSHSQTIEDCFISLLPRRSLVILFWDYHTRERILGKQCFHVVEFNQSLILYLFSMCIKFVGASHSAHGAHGVIWLDGVKLFFAQWLEGLKQALELWRGL